MNRIFSNRNLKRGATPIELVTLAAVIVMVFAYMAFWGYSDSLSQAEYEADSIAAIHAFETPERAAFLTAERELRTGCESEVETSEAGRRVDIRDVFVATSVSCPNWAAGGTTTFDSENIIATTASADTAAVCAGGAIAC